jgi:N-acetyl-anhydromuramyl-L-alanine amidase AmpD
MNQWQKYLIIAVFILALIWAMGQLLRPRAKGVPINIVVYRLKKHLTKRYETRALSGIDTVIIHHSATTGGSPEAYAQYHVDNNGWAGIGYHYVISKSGKIEQTQFLRTVSYHTSGMNSRSIGICLTGNYDIQEPTESQISSLVKLIQHLEKRLGRQLDIQGHNEHSNKSCPGRGISVAQIRNRARNIVA